MDKVKAVARQRLDEIQPIKDGFLAGSVMLDDYRAKLSLPPLPNDAGQIFLWPQGMHPVSVARIKEMLNVPLPGSEEALQLQADYSAPSAPTGPANPETNRPTDAASNRGNNSSTGSRGGSNQATG